MRPGPDTRPTILRASKCAQRLHPHEASTAPQAARTLSRVGAEQSPDHANSFPGRLRTFVSRLIGVRIKRFGTTPLGREARLHNLSVKLEGILGELDDLGAQRIAIDVCMALERVRAHLAAADDAGTSDPDNVV